MPNSKQTDETLQDDYEALAAEYGEDEQVAVSSEKVETLRRQIKAIEQQGKPTPQAEAARPQVLDAAPAQPKPQPAQAVAKVRPPPLKLDEHGTYVTTNQHEEHILACMLMDAGAAPASFSTPVQVMVARQALRSVGLNPYTALRQCGYINGAFTVYGDLELAMVRQSNQLDYIHEFHYCVDDEGKYAKRCFANNNLHLPVAGAVCQIKRKGCEEYEASFTLQDAQQSGLWGRKGPWTSFPARMMQMRARAVAIRNTFSDVTMGIATQEYDFEGIDHGKSNGNA